MFCFKLHRLKPQAVRRLFKLPYRTHCNLLPLIVNDFPIDVQLHLRFLKFLITIVNSNNNIISICVKQAINSGKSSVCKNLLFISEKYNLPRNIIHSKFTSLKKNILSYLSLNENNHLLELAGFIQEIIHNDNNFLEEDELSFLLNDLCCSQTFLSILLS